MVTFSLSIPFIVMKLILNSNSVISEVADKHKLNMSDGFKEKMLKIQRRNAFVSIDIGIKHFIVLLWLVVRQHTYVRLNISFSILQQEQTLMIKIVVTNKLSPHH